jgi:hypothetical protein
MFEAVEFDPAGGVGHVWLVVFVPGVPSAFFAVRGLAGGGGGPRIRELRQERGRGQVKPVRGKPP